MTTRRDGWPRLREEMSREPWNPPACGFAALLYKVVTNSAVSDAVSGLIKRALGTA